MPSTGLKTDLRNHLLFDGNCGICKESARFFRTVDKKHLFQLIPYQDVPEDELKHFGLDYKKCDSAVRLVTAKGRILTGPFALNYMFFKYPPWSSIVTLIYAIPIFLICEIVAYKIVAANRQRISRWLGLDACRLN